MPSRSLFDRISGPPRSGSSGLRDRNRSLSPGRPRVSDVSRPAPESIDRYVPGGGQRARSPLQSGRYAGREGRDGNGRRYEGRRDDSLRRDRRGAGPPRRDNAGANASNMGKDGRPRKTQQELDAEMEDYWGGGQEPTGGAGAGFGAGVDAMGPGGAINGPQAEDHDDMMIE